MTRRRALLSQVFELESRLAPATFNVTTTADSGIGSLRQAISDANGNAGADTINLNTVGTIAITSAVPYQTLNGPTTIVGPGSATLLVSGQKLVRVFTIATGTTVSISGLTIKEGLTADDGGAIFNSGNLTLNNTVVSLSSAVRGGGIFNSNGGTLTVSNSTFSQNMATGTAGGGAIFNDTGTLSISNSTLSNNSATTGSGGGFRSDSPVNAVTLVNSTISNNKAAVGAGVAVSGKFTATDSKISGNTASLAGGGLLVSLGSASVTNSVITSNAVTGGAGGGFIVSDTGTLTLTGPLLANNSASSDGGGIVNLGTVMLTNGFVSGNISGGNGGAVANSKNMSANNSAFSDNSAVGTGGAIHNTSSVSVTNSTLSANTSAGGGGLFSSSGAVLLNATLSGNSASNGGGIQIGGGSLNVLTSTLTANTSGNAGGGLHVVSAASLGIDGSIVAGNTSGKIPSPDISSPVALSLNFSAVGSNVGFTFTGNNNLPFGSSLNLAPLNGNGGFSETHALQAGSAAINAGDPGNASADQRGFAMNGVRDIGAYEVQPVTLNPATLPSGKVGVVFNQLITPQAPTLPAGSAFTFSVSNGAIPPGLALNVLGQLVGIPTLPGTFNFRITATANTGDFGSRDYAVTIMGSALAREFAVGRDAGSTSTVTLRNPDSSVRFTMTPFGTAFTGGIRTATGDFNSDGVADLVAASGPGRAGEVRIFNGVTQAEIPLPQANLPNNQPFGSNFTRGIIVSAGDMNNDGLADLILTAEAGGGARVRIFQSTGSTFTQRSDFIALIGSDGVPDSTIFRGGSRACVSDINGDGFGDLIWAAGAGGGPRVATFNGQLLNNGSNVNFKLTGDFFALANTLRDGAYIAGGDVTGDGIGDLIAGGGSGAPPQVVGFSGATLIANNFSKFLDFTFGNPAILQGVRVAVKDLNGDNNADLVVGQAPTSGARIAGFSGKNMAGSATGTAIFDFSAFPGFLGGVFVG